MDVLADRTDSSCVVSILPYRLRALKQRQRAAAFAVGAATPAPAARRFYDEPSAIRAGIRHIASGRMTVIHAGLETAMGIIATRAAYRAGLLEDASLEAIVVDRNRQIFAGFWA